ncbi:thiamine-phosphate kinase [Atribacter laminatus]|uniref:Thiamine-monophosphate kinase n=1 Tax=Atribacter laminatus TaxID=2847778 RepID=A0A7T1ALT4_ATRLM|nr:thiamine-phosphate kinase [Atribacter laminatus]QPM68283.1 Thiamine-monophosphate kinase [Atribacter laminatus]
MLTLTDIGEFGLIDLIKKKFMPYGPETIVGIDDDCAVVTGREGFYTLYTCDSQVEGSHFIADLVPPYLLGQKVLTVNLSDIAAMGGTPRFALLSLVLRPDISVEWIDTFLEGFRYKANQYAVEVIGGNLAHTEGKLIFDVTCIGEVKRNRLLLRNQARVGDLILVTGSLGDAAAGLKILLEEQKMNTTREQYLLNRYFLPEPRVDVGRILAESPNRIALIDISDGFAQDLGHILKQSQVGGIVDVERIPLSQQLISWCTVQNCFPLDFACSGGEDYELIFVTAPQSADELRKKIQHEIGIPVTIVGEITAGSKLIFEKSEQNYEFHTQGWNHFSSF